MKTILAAAAFAALSASAALGAEVSEAALSECQGRHSDFLMVKKCLAPTHIAIEMMEAVQRPEAYGSAGADLVAACRSKSKASVTAWTCTIQTLWEAKNLLGMVGGDASKITDPAFAPIANQEAYAAISMAEHAMRTEFSSELAGGSYFP